MKQLTLILCLTLLAVHSISAQVGTIAGTVLEAESGFEVIGGNVLVVGSEGLGTVTDLDGSYQLDLEPGIYTIEFSYIGFASQQITDIEIKAGELTSLDIQLGEDVAQLEEVVVTAKAYKNTETALMTIQKKAPVVLDGISSAQISKSGDNDVASAVRRVTGVTVEGGKYVYVRGLGDRYSKTSMNGAEIPGLDPNRNTVQMDIFPTNLIDNIVVYKTFSPDLPADFTGGYVDIATKDFPEQFTFSASGSLGYNTLATFNSDNYITYSGGSTDFLGFDDGTRAVPEVVAANDDIPTYTQGANDAELGRELTDLTRAFSNNWDVINDSPFLNHRLALSIGNQIEVGGKPLGIIAAGSYSRNFSAYSNGIDAIYKLTENAAQATALNTEVFLNEQRGQDEVLWGAMLAASMKLAPTQKIGLTIMRNQSATTSLSVYEGVKFQDDPEDIYFTNTWRFLERSLSTFQLRGKHVFTSANNFEVNWFASYSLSTQDQPDLRYFTQRLRPSGNYQIKPSSDRVPNRFFRDMDQSSFDGKVNAILPFTQWSGLSSQFKVGGGYVTRFRTFLEDRYIFQNQLFSVPNGDIFNYFQPENLLTVEEGGYANNGQGVYLVDNYDPINNYEAQQNVAAAYAMFELPLSAKIRAIFGARMETTIIRFKTFDTNATLFNFPLLDGIQNLIDEVDILPGVNLNYEMTEAMKLRLAYSRTLARPTFRELAPITTFDADNGVNIVGNPNLQRTLIDNIDLRWENFFANGEMISFSAFYKNFTNPIERTFNTEAQNIELTWDNVENAFLYGAEIEVRKNFGFITEPLKALSVVANFSYIISRTDIEASEFELIQAGDPDAEPFRQMFGQAPYVANALLSYKAPEKGTQANLSFNVVGPRISLVTKGATPEYFQQPIPFLNFNISQPFGSGWTARLSANNLLNAKYTETVTFKDNVDTVREYGLGINFSLGLSYRFTK